MGSDKGIVEVSVWFRNLIEHLDCEDDVAAEREGGDEFGCHVRVAVEISAYGLRVDLLRESEVGVAVKL